jgi:hypothetical protein
MPNNKSKNNFLNKKRKKDNKKEKHYKSEFDLGTFKNKVFSELAESNQTEGSGCTNSKYNRIYKEYLQVSYHLNI